MIVVQVKEGENIERALKKFKRKFEKTGVVKELRARQQFDKPSVLKRLAKEHAVYVQHASNGISKPFWPNSDSKTPPKRPNEKTPD